MSGRAARSRASVARAPRWLGAALLGGALACTADMGAPAGPLDPNGNPDDPSDPGDDGPDPSAPGVPLRCEPADRPDTGASVLRRLTKLEYALTLKELFQLSAPPAVDAVPEDNDRDGFRTLSALHTLSAQHLLGYTQVAERLASELTQDTARRDRVLGCQPSAACLETFAQRFGELAYRRPLEAAEVDALVAKAREVGLDQSDQFRFVIEVLLSSSSFLFRLELGDETEGLATLTPHELAARLSFALWGRGPSRELMQQAAAGALDTPEGLSDVATEMLADPRAREFFGAFFEQWLRFEQLRAPTVRPPDWSDGLLADMREESTRVLDDFAFGEGESFLDVLTANYSYVNPSLADFYGLESPGAGFQRVEFEGGDPRADSGLLTHAALIGAKSDGDLVAIRGNWLRKTFLCENLELPAGLLDEVGDELVGLTRLQIIEKRNEETQCKGCHAQIDPIGVGFARFDATGRFDTSVDLGDYPIAAGLPDADDPRFDSIGELGAKLREMPEVASCLASRVFLYTAGRDPVAADGCAVENAADAFSEQGEAFPALVQGIVASEGFRLRRVPEP